LTFYVKVKSGLDPFFKSFSSYLFDSADSTTFQADFNTMGMGWGFSQDIFDNPFCEFPGSLILL
jgi:hypothetical protein